MGTMPARVLSVNVGEIVEEPRPGVVLATAIDKRPASEPVPAGALGLRGDEHRDTVAHGGADQAVYAYAREDLDWWEAEIGRPLVAGQFGENLTTAGLDVTGALIGERWQVGPVVLEVSAPRIPCAVFQAWMGERAWVRRFTEAGRPGAYLRVLTAGDLTAGAPLEVVHRPAHRITVAAAFRALTTERAQSVRLLEVPELSAKAHARARSWVDRQSAR
jgi:MOSC domain-containing protein YiiM